MGELCLPPQGVVEQEEEWVEPLGVVVVVQIEYQQTNNDDDVIIVVLSNCIF